MGYEDRVPQQIRSAGDRVDERTELWEAVAHAYAVDGRDGTETELTSRMDEIRERFDAALGQLDRML